eukprot:CAMPEP_0113630540 /NCGR_PEP_ID=MMETSP0017_2-20120614/15868_1 /TAXON_ID=2856 /ORGANISM="Cylindrotheca closterium" /LENGTH=143 /DNA_ID=CAMNT_0000541009 /DNA_START=82 /DNA_END=513 /DNA_ORIENTATION=- /assembly_acc=CAM_ASM_000147
MGCMGSKPKGTLTIYLDKITNLSDGDWMGKTDPYVTFVCEQDNWVFDQTMGKVTSTKKANDLNPVYGETFTIPVASLKNLVLKVNVYDDDIGFDDKVGCVDIKVDDIISVGQEPVLIEKVIDEKKGKWFSKDSKIYLKLSYTE